MIDRREAIRRVTALLGGVALVGGSSLVAACERAQRGVAAAGAGAGTFSAQDVALLDEVAETILPETKTPGAKAAHVGAFMALMVTDTYEDPEQQIFPPGRRSGGRCSSGSTASRRRTWTAKRTTRRRTTSA